ncbi:hypothetical protein AcV7_007828 [Taiwanofungus camphoratus]|nr:hypothetical protein AcV7_007828 [Antrodia cinnamomea]
MLPKIKTAISAAVTLSILVASHANAASLLKMPLTSTLVNAASNAFNPTAPIYNAVVKLVTPVQAGDNQTFRGVVVDTGSAILWVGGEKQYMPGPYTRAIYLTFSVGYGTGSVNGTAYLDRVTIGDATTMSQIIGSAEYVSGFTLIEPLDGILGLGPSGSNGGEVSGSNTTPTFVENLVSEGIIEKPVFGIYVSPLSENGTSEGVGEITFGGIDQSRFNGTITWLPQNLPYNFHWEFNASSFACGNSVVVDGPIYARTDTGVLYIGIPSDALDSIVQSIPGSTVDGSSPIHTLVFPANITVDSLPSLDIGIGSLTFSFPSSK